MGADLQSPEIVAQRAAYEAKNAEVKKVAAEKSDLTVLFASYGSEDRIYVASPNCELPLNYEGLTTFLEPVLRPLRDAEKVS